MDYRHQRVLSFVACIGVLATFPGKLPAQATGALSGRAHTILGNEPIEIDPDRAYPTVETPPGSPFHAASYASNTIIAQLAHSSDGTVRLPPGDYSIPILLYCTSIHVADTQHGLSYRLLPLEGKRASLLIALMSRAPAAHVPFQALQPLIWQIEGGLSYAQLPRQSQQLVDQLVPELKGQLNEDFVSALEKKLNATEFLIRQLPLPGPARASAQQAAAQIAAMIQRYSITRDMLLRYADNYNALAQQMVHIIPGTAPKAGPTTWSQINSRVYAHITGGSVWQEMAKLEVRVLPSAELMRGGGTREIEVYVPTAVATSTSDSANDSADVPVEAMLAFPGPAFQALVGGVTEPPSTQTVAGAGYALALKIVPVPSTYMLLNSTELSTVQQLLPNGTWLGVGTANSGLFSPSYVALADRLLELPNDLADAVSSFDELGTIGLAEFTGQQLLSLNLKSPPDLVVETANSIVAAITQAQAGLLKQYSCMVTSGAQYKPWFIAGPGQYLVVLVTGLSSDPSSTDLSGLANVTYGFSNGLGECGQYPNTTVGFQVTEVTLSQSIKSVTTTSCPSIFAVSLDASGNTKKSWNVTLPCSSGGANPQMKPPSQPKSLTTQSQKPIADVTIIDNINQKLLADPLLKSREILVTSRNGVVTLAGTVNTQAEKAEVERIAHSQQGVTQIVDRMVVAFSAPATSTPPVVAQGSTGCNGRPASGHLTIWITGTDLSTGLVNVNGVDNRQPTRSAFAWTWGDGTTTQGWFPQSHVYADTRQNYMLQVISHENDGSTDCAQILLRLSGPALSAAPPPPKIAERSGPSPMPSGSPGPLGGKTRSSQSRTIRDVDFLNFDYPSDCWKGWDSREPTKVVHVSNGEWSKEGFGSFSVGQQASRWLISYGDLKGDGQEEAVVVTGCLGEIPSAELALTSPEEILIFAMSSTGPVVLARLRAGGWIGGGRSQQEGQVYDIRVANQRLFVRSLTYGPDAPHCCPDILVTATYRWDGKRLVHTGEDRREPFKSP